MRLKQKTEKKENSWQGSSAQKDLVSELYKSSFTSTEHLPSSRAQLMKENVTLQNYYCHCFLCLYSRKTAIEKDTQCASILTKPLIITLKKLSQHHCLVSAYLQQDPKAFVTHRKWHNRESNFSSRFINRKLPQINSILLCITVS